MRSWLTYTAARLGLFAGAFGIVYLFGARSWIALILAWVISGLASYVLLSTVSYTHLTLPTTPYV